LAGTSAPIEYYNRVANDAGIQRLRLTAGDEGRAKIFVQGKGENLTLPTLPLIPPVTVQLHGGHGQCWSAEFGDFIRQNDARGFVARSGIIP
jgi:hypothetical protein